MPNIYQIIFTSFSFRNQPPSKDVDPRYEMSIRDVRVRPQSTGNINEGYESPPRPHVNQDSDATPEGDSLYQDLDGDTVAAHSYQHLNVQRL